MPVTPVARGSPVAFVSVSADGVPNAPLNVSRPPEAFGATMSLAMMNEGDTVVLDARSADKYRLRHIKGAVNLPFTDFTAASLAGVLPAKDVKVLIYCNNNFLGSPMAFASKMPTASLNLSTYTSLKSYGYTTIFELGPLLDVGKTKIPFEGTEIK